MSTNYLDTTNPDYYAKVSRAGNIVKFYIRGWTTIVLPTTGALISALPVGYRPTAIMYEDTPDGRSSSLQITPNGNITYFPTSQVAQGTAINIAATIIIA